MSSSSSASTAKNQLIFKVKNLPTSTLDIPTEEREENEQQVGFAVAPLWDCPHVPPKDTLLNFISMLPELPLESCAHCDEKWENWICLRCAHVACSHYKAAHMSEHYWKCKTEIIGDDDDAHAVVLSLADLSVWCYVCEAYVTSKELEHVVASVHYKKFGTLPGGYQGSIEMFESREVYVEEKEEEEDDTKGKGKGTSKLNNDDDDSGGGAVEENAEEEEDTDDDDDDDIAASLADMTLNEKAKEKLATAIARVAEKIRNANNIVVLTGAGLSTESNIPDFRTPGTGLYYNLQRFNLPFPTAVFDLDFFNGNPLPFYQLAKGLVGKEDEFLPNDGHFFISLLHEKGKLLRNFTQNIDGLEFKTSIPPEKIVQAHGTFETATCMNHHCKAVYKLPWIRQHLFDDKLEEDEVIVPRCEKCDAVVKSDIVFFGEGLPEQFHDAMHRDMPQADLLIVMGTSLTVYPVAMIPKRVASDVCSARVLINREAGGPFCDPYVESDEDEDTDEDDERYHSIPHKRIPNIEDYFIKGGIGECVSSLIEVLGWKDEFNALSHRFKQHDTVTERD